MKIEKTECNYQVTECDLKFGKQITLNGELLIPISILDKIKRDVFDACSDHYFYIPVRRLNYEEIFEIIDEYKEESEGEK